MAGPYLDVAHSVVLEAIQSGQDDTTGAIERGYKSFYSSVVSGGWIRYIELPTRNSRVKRFMQGRWIRPSTRSLSTGSLRKRIERAKKRLTRAEEF